MLSVARVISIALLVFSFFGLAQASVAARREATNAERLARGLGPAPPRRLYMGSRTNVPRTGPSGIPGPSTTHVGILALFAPGTSPASGASPVAWLGQYKVVKTPDAAFPYRYTQATPPTDPVELDCVNDPGYRLAGMPQGQRSSVRLGPGNLYYVEFHNANVHTDAGAAVGASASTNTKYRLGYAQTTIFTVNPDTGKITVAWVNPDGSVTGQLYVLAYANGLYLTGDVDKFYSQTGSRPEAVQVVDVYFVKGQQLPEIF